MKKTISLLLCITLMCTVAILITACPAIEDTPVIEDTPTPTPKATSTPRASTPSIRKCEDAAGCSKEGTTPLTMKDTGETHYYCKQHYDDYIEILRSLGKDY